jgi:hypothetical protein
VDGFCLGVCYRWSLLYDTLAYGVALVGFLDNTHHVHVNGSDDNPDEKNHDALEVSSSEWWMTPYNHHVILEEANSIDHDGIALNHSTFCLLLLSLLDSDDDVVTKTVVGT